MESALTNRIKPGTGVDVTPEKPLGTVATTPDPAHPKDETVPPGDEPAGTDEPPAGPEPGLEDATTTTPAADGKKAKVNPWKLMEEHKTRAANLEKEVVELKKLVPNAEARKQEMAEVEQLRARAKELEDEIRYVNYAKSPEFKEKYEKPYQQAWSKAMTELREITIEDPNTGASRQITPNDILELVNLPLGKARELAQTTFGDFADDVMAHRKEIKNLFEAQAGALESARNQGEERQKKMLEQYQASMETLNKQIGETWTKANESFTKDEKYGKYFTPVEGDQEGNQRLAKGYELADRAFKENPLDPKLTPEQRESIVKRHAAVRNRAAAFGRLVAMNEKSRARIAELEAELAKFNGSTPSTAGGTAPRATPPTLSARDAMWESLGKLVKPG